MSEEIPAQYPPARTVVRNYGQGRHAGTQSLRVPDPLPTETVDSFAWYPCCPVCMKPVRVLLLDGVARCAHCFVIWSHVPAAPEKGTP